MRDDPALADIAAIRLHQGHQRPGRAGPGVLVEASRSGGLMVVRAGTLVHGHIYPVCSVIALPNETPADVTRQQASRATRAGRVVTMTGRERGEW